MQPIYEAYPDLFSGATKEIWFEMYNFVCTRCFGWGLPCVMMVPMVDFLNHLPVDTQVSMFNLQHSKDKNTDYRIVFKKEFIEQLDPESDIKIRG